MQNTTVLKTRAEMAKKTLEEAVNLYEENSAWVVENILDETGYFSYFQNGGHMAIVTPDYHMLHPKFAKHTSIALPELKTPHDPQSGKNVLATIESMNVGDVRELLVGTNAMTHTGTPGYRMIYMQKMLDGTTLISGYYTDDYIAPDAPMDAFLVKTTLISQS